MESTQVVSITFAGVSAAAFLWVARVVGRREVSPEMRGANRAFVVWWGALAATTLLGGTQTSLAAAGYREVPTFVAMALLNVAFLCLALWGLLHYLLVLIADTRRFAVPLAILYAALAAYFAYLTLGANYTHVALGRWAATLEPRLDFQGWDLFLLLALLLGPQILAALAYLSLYFRVDDRLARRRIVIVSLSILIWFGSAMVVAATQDPRAVQSNDAWQWTSRLLGLAAAGAILYAFAGITPGSGAAVERETPAATDGPPAAEARGRVQPA